MQAGETQAKLEWHIPAPFRLRPCNKIPCVEFASLDSRGELPRKRFEIARLRMGLLPEKRSDRNRTTISRKYFARLLSFYLPVSRFTVPKTGVRGAWKIHRLCHVRKVLEILVTSGSFYTLNLTKLLSDRHRRRFFVLPT